MTTVRHAVKNRKQNYDVLFTVFYFNRPTAEQPQHTKGYSLTF